MRTELFGEENFEEKMQSVVKPWLENSVKGGYFTTSDGVKLRYYYAIPDDAKAAVIIFHGYCEFYGKYHELSYYLYSEGYAFFCLEQRGYGYSHRDLENKELVHIDSFDTYARDQKEFFDNVVNKEAPDLKKFIFSHSMGGAVTSLFLEEYKDYADAAVMSAPLIKMDTLNIPEPIVLVAFSAVNLIGKAKDPIQPKKVFDPVENFPASGTLSPVRYHYLFQQRLDDENYRTWSATLGWSLASIKSTRKLRRHLGEIKQDILLLADGREDRVDPKGFDILIKKAPNLTALSFPDSKHEVFNAATPDRERFYTELFAFFEEHRN